jgi:hypothetical protein
MPLLIMEDRSMKRKVFACAVLVVVCLGVLVVEGVSQSPPSPSSPTTFGSGPIPSGSLAVTPTPAPMPPPKTNFSKVDPLLSTSAQQEWTFEQLVEALKGVRARQKELKAQEADLLSKMADKIEEKRKDLAKAEEALQQLKNDSTHASVGFTREPPLQKSDEQSLRPSPK